MTRLWGLRLLPVAGFFLIAVGVTGDILDWWDKLGYTSNLVAGLTGACFGLPLAFFIINRFSERERNRDEVKRIVAITARELARISWSLKYVGPCDSESDIARICRISREIGDEAASAASAASTTPAASDASSAVDGLYPTMLGERQLSRISDLVVDFNKLHRRFASGKKGEQKQVHWNQARMRWRSVSEELTIRAAIVETDLFRDESSVAKLDIYLDQEFPLDKLEALRDAIAVSWGVVSTSCYDKKGACVVNTLERYQLDKIEQHLRQLVVGSEASRQVKDFFEFRIQFRICIERFTESFGLPRSTSPD